MALYEMKIEKTPPKLFEEVVKTLPCEPKYFKITAIANGIYLPGNTMEDAWNKYISDCTENKIIPSSSIKLEYKHDIGIFIPVPFEEIVEIYKDYSMETMERKNTIIRKLFEGGKVNVMKFESHVPAQEGFQKFRDEILDMLLTNDYRITYGDLWLNAKHSKQHYEEGYYKKDGLVFTATKDATRLGLSISDDAQKAEKKQLVSWFNQLNKKYKQK